MAEITVKGKHTMAFFVCWFVCDASGFLWLLGARHLKWVAVMGGGRAKRDTR